MYGKLNKKRHQQKSRPIKRQIKNKNTIYISKIIMINFIDLLDQNKFTEF